MPPRKEDQQTGAASVVHITTVVGERPAVPPGSQVVESYLFRDEVKNRSGPGSSVQRVSLTMQETDGFDCSGQGCLDAVCDPVERAIRQGETLLLRRYRQVQQFAHPSDPAQLICLIKAHEVTHRERARRLWIGQPVNDRTVSARPGLFSPAEQRHKADANQTLKLGGSLLLIGDDPAIIEEDVQG